MGTGKKKSRSKRKTQNKTPVTAIQTAFNQTVLTKQQWRLYRDMRIAERGILEPNDELYGIAIPTIN